MKRCLLIALLALVPHVKAGMQQDRLVSVIDESARLFETDSVRAFRALTVVAEQAQRVGNMHALAYAYLMMADFQFKKGNTKDAENYYHKSYDLGLQQHNVWIEGRCYYLKAGFFKKKEQFDSSAHYYNKAVKLQEMIRDTFGLVKSLHGAGTLYHVMEDLAKAREYYSKSSDLANVLKDDLLIALNIEAQANLAKSEGNYERALQLYSRLEKIYPRLHKTNALANVFNNMAGIFFDIDEYEKAEHYFLKALEKYREVGNKRDIAIGLANLAAVYNSEHKFPLALQRLRESEELARELGLGYQLSEIYLNRSAVYENKGELKTAINYYKEYKALEDSVFTLEQARYVDELHEKYGSEKKELAIRELQQKNALNESMVLARTRQRNLFVISAVSVLLLGALLALIQRQRIRTQKVVLKKNEEIHKQQINEMLKEQELKSMNAMIEVQDEERKRIAGDLHDRLGSMLSTIKLGFNSLDQKIDAAGKFNQQLFDKNLRMLDEAVDEVRRISHNMVSGVLLNFGLEAALRDLKDTVEENTGISIRLLVNGLEGNRLPPGIEINLYRVVQELLNNTLKHANATTFEIDLNLYQDEINLIVSDNGKGFSEEQAGKSGLGLKSVSSRVEKMNGTLKIDSGKGNGSIFVIEIKLP